MMNSHWELGTDSLSVRPVSAILFTDHAHEQTEFCGEGWLWRSNIVMNFSKMR
jgi:hypothetical protein